MAAKKNVELENAEIFYNKAQDYVRKLEKLEGEISNISMSRAEDTEKRDMYAEALTDLKEKYEGEKESAEHNIKLAISEYLKDSEKQQEKLAKNRDNYEKYIKEEQSKLEALEQEIVSLEGIEEQEDVLADKKEEYEELKAKIEKKLEKLKSYDEKIANLKAEIEQAKEKFKDYIEAPSVEVKNEKIEEVTNNVETPAEENPDNLEEVEKEQDIDDEEIITEPVSDENIVEEEQTLDDETITAEPEENTVNSDTIIADSAAIAEAVAPNATNNHSPRGNYQPRDFSSPVFNTEVNHEVSHTPNNNEDITVEQPETDEQAFNRIYALMSKRKTRNSISNDDIDRMIGILSDKESYDKFNIGTKRFLGLKIFPSKAEKIYKQLGKAISYDVYKITGDKDVLSPKSRKELNDFDEITEFGVSIDEKTVAEISIDKALEHEDTTEVKSQLLDTKGRLEKYRNSMTVLDEVMFNRGDLKFINDNILAPEGKNNSEVENIENVFQDPTPGKEVFEAIKNNNNSLDLGNLVNENPPAPEANNKNEIDDKDVVISDGDIRF